MNPRQPQLLGFTDDFLRVPLISPEGPIAGMPGEYLNTVSKALDLSLAGFVGQCLGSGPWASILRLALGG
jgi:hypothetical protein